MDTIVPNGRTGPSAVDRRIAARLKERREGLGLSLGDLAARSGVSRAMISKVERCAASPTAALLGRLCNGLGITLTSLMASAEQPGSPLARAAAQPIWRDPATGLTRTVATPARTGSPVEVVRIELPAGSSVAYQAQRHLDYEQHVLLLDGSLDVTLGEERFVLAPGDCLHMRPSQDLCFANPGRAACRYLVILRKER
jgi:transcriptional regulator with XRE-family HTH domain